VLARSGVNGTIESVMGQHISGIPFRGPQAASGVQPIAYLLVAVAASAIAIWGSVVHSDSASFRPPSSIAAPAGAPVQAGASVPGAGSASPLRHAPAPVSASVSVPTPTATARATIATGAYTISYGFDGGAGNLGQGLGSAPRLKPVGANGGALRTTTHAGGDAIGFPGLCATPGAASCARAILETSGDVSALNPGSRDIRFGADIKLPRDETSDGENVVQKGFATGGSEYKLQVDGVAGMPSCALVGVSSPTIYLAKSSVSIDDGEWHAVTCGLHAGVLSITVDGIVRGKRNVPKSLIVSNSDELRIGGKGTSTNNDQFDGELDDVWVTIGS
jgi:hypothetical protein